MQHIGKILPNQRPQGIQPAKYIAALGIDVPRQFLYIVGQSIKSDITLPQSGAFNSGCCAKHSQLLNELLKIGQ